MKIKFEWESIESHTYRAKVTGGWIVKVDNNNFSASAMVFIKDPLHVWELD